METGIQLRELTSFRVGGTPLRYYHPQDKAELLEALAECRQQELPWRVLGGGTNLLVDEGVLGLRAGKSTREQARAARRCLAGVGSKLVGVILNAVDPKKSPYSYYRYPYVGKRGERET